MPLKFRYIRIKPDRFSQIPLQTDFFKRMKILCVRVSSVSSSMVSDFNKCVFSQILNHIFIVLSPLSLTFIHQKCCGNGCIQRLHLSLHGNLQIAIRTLCNFIRQTVPLISNQEATCPGKIKGIIICISFKCAAYNRIFSLCSSSSRSGRCSVIRYGTR